MVKAVVRFLSNSFKLSIVLRRRAHGSYGQSVLSRFGRCAKAPRVAIARPTSGSERWSVPDPHLRFFELASIQLAL